MQKGHVIKVKAKRGEKDKKGQLEREKVDRIFLLGLIEKDKSNPPVERRITMSNNPSLKKESKDNPKN